MAGQGWVCARRAGPGLWRPKRNPCPRFALLIPARYSFLVYLPGCNGKKIPVAHDVTGLLRRGETEQVLEQIRLDDAGKGLNGSEPPPPERLMRLG
jgi:hypothetical protein